MNTEVTPPDRGDAIRRICAETAYQLRLAEAVGRKSARRRGIYHYASDLLEEQAERMKPDATSFPTKESLLNGASDWTAYCWGG